MKKLIENLNEDSTSIVVELYSKLKLVKVGSGATSKIGTTAQYSSHGIDINMIFDIAEGTNIAYSDVLALLIAYLTKDSQLKALWANNLMGSKEAKESTEEFKKEKESLAIRTAALINKSLRLSKGE